MLGSGDNNNNPIIKDQSILYSNRGLVSGSNLRYIDVVALNTNTSYKTLVFNNEEPRVLSLSKFRDKPAEPISQTNPEKTAPSFANFSMYGSIYAQNLSIDNLSKFNTIDGGVVKFRGACNNTTNVCIDPPPQPGP
jgi:hypothetical protein